MLSVINMSVYCSLVDKFLLNPLAVYLVVSDTFIQYLTQEYIGIGDHPKYCSWKFMSDDSKANQHG